MTKMVKNLSKANTRNIDGFVRREDLDFNDDGNHFTGWEYKGMPITTLRSNKWNETYLAIRVDYIMSDKNFTYDEWYATDESKLTDMFNGVSEFDLDQLILNLETVIAKVDELDAAVANEQIEDCEIIAKLEQEVTFVNEELENAKQMQWWNLSGYYVKSAADYIRSLQQKADSINEKLEALNNAEVSRKELKKMQECFEKYGYVAIKEDDFYVMQLRKYTEKAAA